jgi:hypothetical protein
MVMKGGAVGKERSLETGRKLLTGTAKKVDKEKP